MKLDPKVLDQALREWIANDLQLEIDEDEAPELVAIQSSPPTCNVSAKLKNKSPAR